MNYIERVRSILLKYSKKEKNGKQPKVKEVKQGTVKFFVYGVLVLLFIVGFFGSLRAVGLSNQVKNLKDTVVAIKKESGQKVTDTGLDISRVQYYMNNFVYTYINYSDATAEKRKAELENYYSFSSSNLTDEIKKDRVLQTQRLISVTKEKDYYVALMRIGYDVDKKSYQMTLAIPFQMADGLLAIVSQPYTLAEDLYQGKSKTFERKSPDEVKSLTKDEITSIQKFLPVFFDKYASSNKTDLKLLMKKPELMGKGYKVSDIDMNTALYYQEDNKKVAQVSVVFEDLVTGGKRSENFTLQLVKSENGWYIEKLYHYFK
ncbi:TPA: conjugal transfer protein [Streptococcus agalactiae]|uniref:Conjugal transfer protein n=1 Tax=Streptococcus porcinus TaxID=1340 RepID=A0A7W0ARG9_STRPO|nr:conjugal transfer protein [Streptococcus porcinus]HEN0128871.1 conjugal transfer protein [Streptococcus agalactiae]MBA2796246.1 conjugal transfer protein [Streptococcus porcinus]HEN0669352.1 conjugal transfer protein [Streptococcus agalactiae]HEN0679272.1 conjugal transfer protein [Streptococcus agalactiae]HEN0765023.1 conjugal transfer protein [Streptococcus agalactiae]